MSIAVVFPGQGSFAPGCATAWRQGDTRAVIDEVSAAVGFDVATASDSEDAGRRTAVGQPVIFATSMAAWHALVARGVRPDVVAGHSLGEYAAATAAGVLPLAGGARVVAARGAAMAAACEGPEPGAMAAVIKVDIGEVHALVAEHDDLVVANDNAPGQVVIAGARRAIEAVRERVRELGGRVLPLDVEGAFHSPAMAPAVGPVRAAIDAETVADPTVDILSGSIVQVVRSAKGAVRSLVDGILASVRWREVQLALAARGITDLVELGPGSVLAGLARRTVPDLRTHVVSHPDQLDDVVAALA